MKIGFRLRSLRDAHGRFRRPTRKERDQLKTCEQILAWMHKSDPQMEKNKELAFRMMLIGTGITQEVWVENDPQE